MTSYYGSSAAIKTKSILYYVSVCINTSLELIIIIIIFTSSALCTILFLYDNQRLVLNSSGINERLGLLLKKKKN